MKSYKQLLSEVAWQGPVEEKVFQTGYMIPFTSKLIKRVYGESKTIKAFHITHLSKINDLAKLQNTKKAISAITELRNSEFAKDLLTYGITDENAGGGLMVKIKGNLLIYGQNDIGSEPDIGGTRWVGLGSINSDLGYDLHNTIDKEISKKLEKLLKETLGQIYAASHKLKPNDDTDEHRAKLNALQNTSVRIYGRWGLLRKIFRDSKVYNKIKGKLIKNYIDIVNNIMIKYADKIKERIFDSNLNKAPKVSEYNELIVNEIKIIEVAVIGSTKRLWQLRSLDKKYKTTYVPEEDINSFVKGTIYKGFLKL